MTTVGFIGCGRIGSAILKRIANKGGDFQLLAHDHNRGKIDLVNRHVERLQEKAKENAIPAQIVTFVESVAELAQKSDYIIIAIQQNELYPLLEELTPHLTDKKVIISTMASVSSKVILAKTHYTSPVIRMIANIPSVYGKGVIGICHPKELPGIEIKNRMTYFINDIQEDFIGKFFKPLGQIHYVSEDKISIFTAIIACGPAYTFFFMEAMLQAALTVGVSYSDAKKAIAACVEGSAYMGSRDTQNFSDLRLQASPSGGIAIQAINQMELKAVRGEITNAILIAHECNIAKEKKYDEVAMTKNK